MLNRVRLQQADFDAVIIGAGFSGMYMLHSLREQGLRVRVYEGGSNVGGTWYWNQYPGARCDTPSTHYSYSFLPELEQQWSWSERFPRQPEILRYLNTVADYLDLRRDIQFDTWVKSIEYNDETLLWQLTTHTDELITARYCISGVGCLSTPNLPKFAGIERFKGEIYLSSRWPQEPIDFSGKRVGIIGTGATGIQTIHEISSQVQHLTVFQRTPNFVAPAGNHPLYEDDQRAIKSHYREIREWDRNSECGVYDYKLINHVHALDMTPEQREQALEAAWNKGGFAMLFVFKEITSNRQVNEIVADFFRRKIAQIVKDPETARKLMPTDYPFATKRMPICDGYYEIFNQENVDLVDVRETPIIEITENGLRTSDHEYQFDILICATGFDAITGSLLRLNIRGRNGLSLNEKWAEAPHTYLGIQTHGFPNFFMINGPGSPSILINAPVAIEQHVEWIRDCILHLDQQKLLGIEPEREAELAWFDRVCSLAAKTLHYEADSWAVGANIPGKPRLYLAYLSGIADYRRLCNQIAQDNYQGFIQHAPKQPELVMAEKTKLPKAKARHKTSLPHAAQVVVPSPALADSEFIS